MMISKRKSTAFAFAMGLLASTATVSAQQFTMKISSPTVGDVTQEWMKTFKSGVEGRAAGKIKVELYPAGQLGAIPATVDGVALGTIEAVIPASGFLAGLEPRFTVLDLPAIFNDLAHAQRVHNSPEAKQLYAKFGASKGVEPIAIIAHGPAMIVSHKPIRTVADFKGQKVRVIAGTPLFIETAKKLGISPVAMALGEVLPALQNKALDGSVTGLTVLTSMKYFDVAKAATSIPSGIISVGVLSNTKWLKGLGPDLEKVVREEAAKANTTVNKFGQDDVAAARGVWRKNGGEVIDLVPAEDAKYREAVTSALPPLLEKNATLKADYAALLAIAKKYAK